MGTSNKCLFIHLCILFLVFNFIACNAVSDTITVTQTLMDGDIISSAGGSFELGFFRPGSSKNRYVGIWYKNINVTTPVWVANRETPLTDSSGILKVKEPGILVLLNSTNQMIWSSNVSKSVQNPVAQLLDSGNLVIKNAGEENAKNFLWQSFDYPGNTIIAGMKLGKNFVSGREWSITSWKSEDDPSPGDYKYRMDTDGFPQMFIWNGENEAFRAGPWIGDRFSGAPKLKPNTIYKYSFMYSKDEVNYSYVVLNGLVLPRRVLSPAGVMQWWTWTERTSSWVVYSKGPPVDPCDTYALCGAYGSCNIDNSPICGCLNKFVAKQPSEYNSGDWLTGCVRRTPLNCKKGDVFLKYSELKLPDTRNVWFDTSMTLEECRSMCVGNCSCIAYSNMNFNGEGSGCFLWFEDLLDLRKVAVVGQDVYFRMAFSEAASTVASDKKKNDRIIVGVAIGIAMILLCLSLTLFIWKKKQHQLPRVGEIRDAYEHSHSNRTCKEDLELPLFELATIIDATDNFSLRNKLGEGGYGTVFKVAEDRNDPLSVYYCDGCTEKSQISSCRFTVIKANEVERSLTVSMTAILEEEQEVAVKRLSRDSSQGFVEFMNEVTFIAKLQHRNLVKLLGCCIQAEEKMLIYEYMPNKSLDCFIFDDARGSILDWPMRFHIITGISRGLVYLHQDSRLRIIHRDLKASNILLDSDMNPKIADFGMARCFGGNETAANTMRVVGTYGYMSPEYQLDGIISMKTDVFSFGVLVLEIISGMKNRGFHHPEHHLNLVGHAWTLLNEGRSIELVDAHLVHSCHLYETLRSIHVALLCVQQNPDDRPTMSDVLIMLGGSGELPQPKQPGFFTERNALKGVSGGYTSCKGARSSTTNEVTITHLGPR